MADTQPPIGHVDSIDSQDPNHEGDKTKAKSRRPANTAFRQQRLKAWQPILTPKTVLPLFFAIGIIFAPIGGGLLFASAVVQELIIDYSKCYTDAPDFQNGFADIPSGNIISHFTKNPSQTQQFDYKWAKNATNFTNNAQIQTPTVQCFLQFGIPNTMKAPVLFYYKLTNFYQNHRRYAKSFDSDQLSGKAVSLKDIHSSDCTPLTTTNGTNEGSLPYYPCGLAANSQFNDTFHNPVLQDTQNNPASEQEYTMTNQSISWASDKKLYGQTAYAWDQVAVPPNWVARYGEQYTNDSHPDLVNDEDFQVWMRLAGLPTFSKLAMRNDVDDMAVGQYQIVIDHNFNVTEYGGTKSILISTRTVVGGKNPFLGIAYVVVGGLCIVLGVLFTVTHLIRPRKLGDHTYLSWNNEATTATASGRDGVLAGERS